MAMAPSAAASARSAVVSFPARPAASSARPRSAGLGVRASAAKGGGNGKWWAPLLGWSGNADYLEAPAPLTAKQDDEAARRQFVGVMAEEVMMTEEKCLLFMYLLFGGLKFHQEYMAFFGSGI